MASPTAAAVVTTPATAAATATTQAAAACAATPGRGACIDGMQTCLKSGEFAAWGPCTGDARPGVEMCEDPNADKNCNGLKGCDDPDCAGKLGCCAPGMMRKCYSGPMGTDGVGPCHGGMQTCDQQGAWPMTCDGEVLPGAEGGHCHDNLDNDC